MHYLGVLTLAASAAAIQISVTPHDSYSSSVGVLGCKINTNRIAYWPGSVDCNNICVQVSYSGRSVYLLRIDQSGGAHDISYDAWNYLQTGKSATVDPIYGGGIAMDYEDVDASQCIDLLYTPDSRLPLSASNSMNFVASCLADSSSWVAQNYALYNILDPICEWGYDEKCSLDLDVSNQPSCPHTLGLTDALTTAPIYNIQYGTGAAVDAATGQVVDAETATIGDTKNDSSTGSGSSAVTVSTLSTKSAVAVSSLPFATQTTTSVAGTAAETAAETTTAVSHSPAAVFIETSASSSIVAEIATATSTSTFSSAASKSALPTTKASSAITTTTSAASSSAILTAVTSSAIITTASAASSSIVSARSSFTSATLKTSGHVTVVSTLSADTSRKTTLAVTTVSSTKRVSATGTSSTASTSSSSTAVFISGATAGASLWPTAVFSAVWLAWNTLA